MADEERCPCDAVKRLQIEKDTQRTDITALQVSLAIITTRLNMLIAVLGVIGIALIGICAKLMFPGVR